MYHEIVNDRVGGLNVSVTYCPLTATAQVFERGESTLGTSGRLLNNNLVMYDRETGSFCSQMAATCYRGDHTGETLVEHDAVWTTWERWRSVHPDTRVLTEDTGYLRSYDRDPYGEYTRFSLLPTSTMRPLERTRAPAASVRYLMWTHTVGGGKK